jgi:hypothetical protein
MTAAVRATEMDTMIMGRLVLASGATPREEVGRVQDKSPNRPLFYICKTPSTTWASQAIRIDTYTEVLPTCSTTTGESGTTSTHWT